MKKIFAFTLLTLALTGCASLEERLCNSTTAYQRGYDDVINGRTDSPGLKEGEACNNSKSFSYNSYHRDYMAGFEKGKQVHCVPETAAKLGTADAKAEKEFRSSLAKLDVCTNDNKLGRNLKNIYETAYRKEFCQSTTAQSWGQKDARGLGEAKRTIDSFSVCAYQASTLYKVYMNTYVEGVRKECTPTRAASLAVSHARDSKRLDQGLEMLDRCPKDMIDRATTAYTAAYQNESATMRDEERIRIEKARLAQESENQKKLLEIQQQQLDLKKQKQDQQAAGAYPHY